MLYVCPICKKEYTEEEKVTKCYMSCWKREHPNTESKSAPRSEDITTREDNQDILNFFNSFK